MFAQIIVGRLLLNSQSKHLLTIIVRDCQARMCRANLAARAVLFPPFALSLDVPFRDSQMQLSRAVK